MSNNYVTSGASSGGLTFGSFTYLIVLSGGTAGQIVLSGGEAYVSSGGTLSGATMSAYGNAFANGLIIDSLLSGGGVNVSSGGTVIGSKEYDFGYETISSGGLSISATFNTDGGKQYVFSGASAASAIFNSGAQEYETGGTVTSLTLNGAFAYVDGTVNGVSIDSGSYLYAEPGAKVFGAVVNSASFEYVNGGTAIGSIISSGGINVVGYGGTAIGATVYGAEQILSYGGLASDTIVSSGGQIFVYTSALLNGATLSAAFLAISSGTAEATLIGSGSTEVVTRSGVDTGATVYGGGTETILSAGTMSGAVISSGGQEVISSGGYVDGSASFAGAGGTIEIEQSSGVLSGGGTIEGWTPAGTDVINFQRGFTAATLVSAPANNTVVVNNALTIYVQGAISGEALHLAADPALGGVDLACFLEGTHIATPGGETAIEGLHEDDLVLTTSGAAKPIRWIGMRRIETARLKQQHLVSPICLRAGAVAEAVPKRDLWVTPDHALFVDGKLIPARLLVNGASIRQVPLARYTYYHIELEPHDLLLAEGLAAESYLDIEASRLQFANHSITALRPVPPLASVAEAAYEAHGCAPLSLTETAVKPVWERLAARAGGAASLPTTAEPDLHLLVAGARIAARVISGGRYRFPLPPGAREVVIASRSASPSASAPWLEDRRMLGVAMGAMWLICGDAAVNLPLAGGEGWHSLETDPATGATWRWTDGRARLALPGSDAPRWLEMEVTGTQRYPLPRYRQPSEAADYLSRGQDGLRRYAGNSDNAAIWR